MRTLIACLLSVAFLSAPLARADTSYPREPIELMVGYTAGGSVDLTARVLAERLSSRLGVPIMVDNRPGATGNIAADVLVKSPADGYTLYLATSTNAASVNLFKNLGYDPVRDFAPITRLVEAQTTLVVRKDLAVKNVQELMQLAKQAPDRVSYGSTGNGSTPHLCAAMLGNAVGAQMLHVPYKGGPQVMADLVGGRIDMTFSNPVSVIGQVKTGQVRALAVLGSSRLMELPEVPTFAEAGVADCGVDSWYGIVAPAGTPAPILERLSKEIRAVMSMPEVQETLAKQGLKVVLDTPAEFAEKMKRDVAKYKRVLEIAKVEPN